jgi:valyl-tRNA synthetase
MEELKKNIILGKAVLEPKTFKFEILVCFWVTIHLELLEYA